MSAVIRGLAALALSALAIASCTSVIGADGYADASAELCALLHRCSTEPSEQACLERVGNALATGRASGLDQGFLTSYANNRCTASCSNARSCLDHTPLCVAHGATCAHREDCCRFTSGAETCDASTGRCCSPRGTACTTDDDCCTGEGPCLQAGASATCGGVQCVTKLAPCAVDEECCTKSCRSHQCGELCGEAGYECTSKQDCCAGLDCIDGRCGTKPCSVLGVTCEQSSECCDGNPCAKLAKASTIGVCSTGADCYPENVHCARDGDCCSKFCNKDFFVCAPMCQPVGQSCQDDGDCCTRACSGGACVMPACSTTFCSKGTDCCSGSCVKGACAPACATPQDCASATHGPCVEGGPLHMGCSTCVDAVCKSDAACCCLAWDSLCVVEALGNASCNSCL